MFCIDSYVGPTLHFPKESSSNVQSYKLVSRLLLTHRDIFITSICGSGTRILPSAVWHRYSESTFKTIL